MHIYIHIYIYTYIYTHIYIHAYLHTQLNNTKTTPYCFFINSKGERLTKIH